MSTEVFKTISERLSTETATTPNISKDLDETITEQVEADSNVQNNPEFVQETVCFQTVPSATSSFEKVVPNPEDSSKEYQQSSSSTPPVDSSSNSSTSSQNLALLKFAPVIATIISGVFKTYKNNRGIQKLSKECYNSVLNRHKLKNSQFSRETLSSTNNWSILNFANSISTKLRRK
uniref:Uncharacterized protein n=1 Tax=Panagrolaimus sp. JU765 TaxID=591449 RepID=A0AC34RSK0_9BILA